MRYLLVSAAAVMAITGAATLGNAQTQENDKGQGPAAEGKAPAPGGAQRAPDGGDRARQSAPNRTEEKPEPRKGAEREPDKDQPRAAQQPKEQQPKSTQGPQTDKERSKSATQPQRDKDQQRSSEQRQRDDAQKSTERKTDADRKSDADRKAADQRQGDNDRQKSTDQRRQGDQDRQKSTQGPDQKRKGRVQVTDEKRKGVRERVVRERNVERTRINVSINVGTTIPRSVRLHRFPTTVVAFEPAYRGYSYVLLEDDTIVVVDERTYVIVDVIPAGTQRADRPGRSLTLSADDMRFIYRTAPKGRTANVRVRLALGAEVPRDVELLAFPDEIVDRVPDLRRYRYVVAEDDIVVVDPDDHAVALVINE